MREEHQEKLIKDAEKLAREQEEQEKKEAAVKAAKEHKKYGFISVSVGEGLSTLFKELNVDYIIEGGQTMNPSTEDMLTAIEKVNAKNIFILPNNKNIIMAANQAAELVEDKKIVVIPSKSVPQCISAMVEFNDKKSAEANEKAMNKAIGRVTSGQLTYAVRDTEIDGIEIKKDDILGMVEGKIVTVGKDIDDVLNRVVSQMVDEDTEFLNVYYGKEIKKPQADVMLKALETKYADDEIEVSFKKGGQPLYYYIISAE